MKRYRVSKDAERDLDEIFVYWAKRTSVEVAGRLIDAIAERFWIIGENPRCGRACGDIAPGVRCFPAGKYLVYYRKMRQAVEILHVFHGAQDQERVLNKT
ncbi:MAG TPA: type II toxin-antitoxin system RelE/ParE family toxin [Bryobacteraceae bacterium]|jgi:toxin ParE1/3/4|nr:type II toxin-antitoxin system RelE/ParE family toxin [Bryobacteraceae bacterium]